MSRSLVRVLGVLAAAVAGVAVGSSMWSPASAGTADNAYTAVTPCAVADSRASQGATGGFAGPYTVNEVKDVQVTGTIPAAQGTLGATTCGVPVGADAVLVNIVAVNPSQPGNLRAYATGGAPPNGGVVNFANLTGEKLNTANAVAIPLSASGQMALNATCGSATCAGNPATAVVDVRAVVLGYFTDDLVNRTTALEAEVDALQALLADVTRLPAGIGGQDTLRFSGMNVQIVDGSGDTPCAPCNAQGNLVVGYASNNLGLARTGSHNIVGGDHNGWSSYGGAVLGLFNQTTQGLATVTAGQQNIASGFNASVSGGQKNVASGANSSVSGGGGGTTEDGNVASGNLSSITGGRANDATGVTALVAGGDSNLASGEASVVAGGGGGGGVDFSNTASGFASFVAGGFANSAGGSRSTAVGGIGNTAAMDNVASVFGGFNNSSTGFQTTILGGILNSTAGSGSTIVGGYDNDAAGNADVVVGGTLNLTSADTATAVGGRLNVVSGRTALVAGGRHNEASAEHGFVAGGRYNQATDAGCGDFLGGAAVVGGQYNLATGCRASVFGGGHENETFRNVASGVFATVSGGDNNRASADRASIYGGTDNTASAPFGAVLGGFSNDVTAANCTNPIAAPTITGGRNNTASGCWSSISGGEGGSVTGPDDWRAGNLFETA